MSNRESRRPSAERVLPLAAGFPGADPLAAVRQAGERLLAVADDAIRHTLSGDSHDFVRASRQEGGQ